MFIMYKAVDGVVTELFIYSKQDNVILESKVAPYNEMDLSSNYTDYRDENAGGGYRRFHLALNKPMDIHNVLYIDERDITCFTHVNRWVNCGRRTEEAMQVGGRIKL